MVLVGQEKVYTIDINTILHLTVSNNYMEIKCKQGLDVQPPSAPNVCLTHSILCPRYSAEVYAPTLLLPLHPSPWNFHLQKLAIVL